MGRTPISVNRFCFSRPFNCGKPAGAFTPSVLDEARGRAARGIAVVVRPKAESAPEACNILRRVICVSWLSGRMHLLYLFDLDNKQVYFTRTEADLQKF